MSDYAVVLNGGLTVHKKEGRVRWNKQIEKIVQQHVDMYNNYDHRTQMDAARAAHKELNARFKKFNGSVDAVYQRVIKLYKAIPDTEIVYGNEKKIASCKIVIEYNDGTTLEMPVKVPKGVHVSV